MSPKPVYEVGCFALNPEWFRLKNLERQKIALIEMSNDIRSLQEAIGDLEDIREQLRQAR